MATGTPQVGQFTQLLVRISDDLTSDDVGLMKSILNMDDDIPIHARELEAVNNGMDIFSLLKTRNLLSSNNLSLLKSLLQTMKKFELLEEIERFEQSNGSEIPGAATREEHLQLNNHISRLNLVTSPILPYNLPESGQRRMLSPDALPSQPHLDADDTFLKQRISQSDGARFNFSAPEELASGRHSQPCRSIRLPSSNFTESCSAAAIACESPEMIETDGDPGTVGHFFREILYERQESSVKSPRVGIVGTVTVSPTISPDHSADTSSTLHSSGMELHGLSQPAAFKLRGYQLELAEPSLKGLNSIICAPTGSGKTLTAAFIFQERWKLARHEEKSYRGLFIVCQRTLVEQQRRALEEFLGTVDKGIRVSAVEENQLLKDVLILPCHLIVLTAQKLVNALVASSVKIEDFGMLIMDECHHTDLKHAYNKIMQFYHHLRLRTPQVPLPMIVGLTASLGVGTGKTETSVMHHYINIGANLNCRRIAYVRNQIHLQELLHFNPKPSADQIKSVEQRPKNSPFYEIMTEFMANIETAARIMFSKPQERGTQTYENWVVSCKAKAKARDDVPHVIVACEVLEKLNLAWMLHDQLRIKDAKEYLDAFFDDDWLPLTAHDIQMNIFQWYMNASERLSKLVEDETVESCPQLHQLCSLLSHLHNNHADPRGILLARTRLAVDRLIQFLGEQREFQGLIIPEKFVGQGGEDGLTQTEQENTLRRFRLGKEDPTRINLLVATDVAQEGLDMPKCNYVIRYNFVSNEIGSVQARGRARAPNSELYLIVTSGSINEVRELDNLQKEHQMQQALKVIDQVPDMKFQKLFCEAQTINWQNYLSQLERDRQRSLSIDPASVKIHCSKCKVYLCDAVDMRLRGSNYICIDEDFESRVFFKETRNGQEFVTEIHMGGLFCKALTCPGNKLGLKIKYKQGRRMYGLVLGKDGCVWQLQGAKDFVAIKQWSKVPFMIEREDPEGSTF